MSDFSKPVLFWRQCINGRVAHAVRLVYRTYSNEATCGFEPKRFDLDGEVWPHGMLFNTKCVKCLDLTEGREVYL